MMAEITSFNNTINKEINAIALMEKSFTKDTPIVENLFPVGVSLFGAPQKAGKTFFALQLALSVSSGNDFIGKKVSIGHVLYIALEDGQPAFQKRIKRFNIQITDNLDFLFERAYNRMFDLEKVIKEYKEKNEDLRLVVIDTFAKIRNRPKVEYDIEYEEVTAIHELALKYNICILLVTHVKKKIDFNNPFDSIYGSRGVTAAADSILVMFKRDVINKIKELHITGKDIPDECLFLIQDETLSFSIAEDVTVDERINENLIRVIHYIVAKKKYIGSHQELASLLGIQLTGTQLYHLLNSNKDVLKESFIVYEKKLQRAGKARKMSLKYMGDSDD